MKENNNALPPSGGGDQGAYLLLSAEGLPYLLESREDFTKVFYPLFRWFVGMDYDRPKGLAGAMFDMQASRQLRNLETWKNKSNAGKRSSAAKAEAVRANGCKGGRPRKTENQTETKQKPNGNQTETKDPNPNYNVNHNPALNHNQEEEKREDKQANNIESKTNIEKQPKPTALPAAATDDKSSSKGREIKRKEIAHEARSRLIAQGMSAEEATKRLRAVSEAFKAQAHELQAENFKGISNPKNYLVAKLFGMAKDCNLSASNPSEPEPRALCDILDLLRDRALKTCEEKLGDLDPFEKGDVKNCFDPDMLARQKYNQWNKLTEKEGLDWYNEPSPVTCVEKVLGLNFALQGVVAKIEAERYKLAKRRIPEYRERIQDLEKQLEGKRCPDIKEPGAGYALVPWRELAEKRERLPIYERWVAAYEKTHQQEVA